MDDLKLNYPTELPVSEHRADILEALKTNPAVIVCGDTGSGKTTQLPKMAMEYWCLVPDTRHQAPPIAASPARSPGASRPSRWPSASPPS